MSRWSDEIERLDPVEDHERIVYLLGSCEFGWDSEKALEFALFRTYAVPSISGLLARTGAFRTETRKRYDDTELLLSEISENGQESPRTAPPWPASTRCTGITGSPTQTCSPC